MATSPAFAQVAKVSRTMELVVTILTTISVGVITAATIWVGFKVMWQHAKLAEVANVIWGAMLVGGATGFAAMWYSA